MKAGFAERDITPKPGMERPGGYGKAYHTDKVHDPCKVRAAVFDDGGRSVALVGVDGLMVMGFMVAGARKDIQGRCGIAPECVMVGASHSHSAGPLGMLMPGDFDHASQLVQDLAYKKSTCANPEFVEHVRKQIVAAVCEAYEKRVEARCAAGSGREDKAAYNRRFRMKDGLSHTHPGKGNPNIIEPAGPTDPEVGVVGAWDTGGKFLGCVVNFACHGTTGAGSTSADWIWFLEHTIRGVMGQNAGVVFLNGACGDVTQVNNLSPYATEFGERSARFVGGRVGAEAIKILVGLEAGDLSPVTGSNRILHIPRRRPSPARLKRAMDIMKYDPSKPGSSEWTSKPDATEWTFAKEVLILEAILAKSPVADVEVQAVQVGPAVFLANPAEFFCQFGLDLKARSKFPFTFPVELANDCVGYVPTPEAMGEHGGGYETRLSGYSNLEVDAGPKIVEALLELAAGMTPGKVPTPPLAPPAKASWTYGSVPPERE